MLRMKGRYYRPPFRITELLQLTHLGIPLEHITWSRVTMTSNEWICVRHRTCNNRKIHSKCGTAITILNPQNSQPHTFQANSATSAKMNPEKPLLALRADSRFHVYDLESKKCCYRCRLDFDINLWTWINSSTIALVSDCFVYHWNLLEENVLPERVFRLDSRIENTQLVHYTANDGLNWFAVTGLYIEDNRVAGVTQIYNSDRDLCQIIEAHCVHFTSYVFKGNLYPSWVLIVASRGADAYGKLHVMELGPHVNGNLAPTSHAGMLEFYDIWCHYDFPSSIQVSSRVGLVYIVTKYGMLYVHDLETCTALCYLNICTDVIFTTAFNHETEGIITISRNGQVLSIDLKMDHLVRYVWEVTKRTHIAERLLHILQREREEAEESESQHMLTTKL